MLKPSGVMPVPSKWTVSMTAPPTPSPAAALRFSNIYTSDMVLQSEPKQAIVWGFCAPGDSVTVNFGSDSSSPIQLTTRTSLFRGDHVWTAKLPATGASIKEQYTLSAKSAMGGKTRTLTGEQ
jgi:hypothetical protein